MYTVSQLLVKDFYHELLPRSHGVDVVFIATHKSPQE